MRYNIVMIIVIFYISKDIRYIKKIDNCEMDDYLNDILPNEIHYMIIEYLDVYALIYSHVNIKSLDLTKQIFQDKKWNYKEKCCELLEFCIKNNYFNIIQWIYNNNLYHIYQLNEICQLSLKYNQKHILYWSINHGFHYDEIWELAAYYGDIEILEFLNEKIERQSLYRDWSMIYAILSRKMEIIEWFYNHNCCINRYTYYIAESTDENILKWLKEMTNR